MCIDYLWKRLSGTPRAAPTTPVMNWSRNKSSANAWITQFYAYLDKDDGGTGGTAIASTVVRMEEDISSSSKQKSPVASRPDQDPMNAASAGDPASLATTFVTATQIASPPSDPIPTPTPVSTYLHSNKRRKTSTFTLRISLDQDAYPDARPVILVKPISWMNTSGKVVRKLMRDYPLVSVQDMLIVHDELEKELGKMSLKQGGSSGGHNGIQSIIDCIHEDVRQVVGDLVHYHLGLWTFTYRY